MAIRVFFLQYGARAFGWLGFEFNMHVALFAGGALWSGASGLSRWRYGVSWPEMVVPGGKWATYRARLFQQKPKKNMTEQGG